MSHETPPGGKSKRQAHAERQRALGWKNMLSMRLQYALFKIENGWTRQSLSEVENLYYRRQRNAPKTPQDRKAHEARVGAMGGLNASPSVERGQENAESATYADFWSRLGTAKGSPSQAPEPGHAPTQNIPGARPAQAQSVPAKREPPAWESEGGAARTAPPAPSHGHLFEASTSNDHAAAHPVRASPTAAPSHPVRPSPAAADGAHAAAHTPHYRHDDTTLEPNNNDPDAAHTAKRARVDMPS